MQINLDERYRNMPTQLDYILNNYFQSAFYGGFANGKTEALCWRAILLSLLYPGIVGIIGRHTYPELRDSTIRSFFDICPPELIKSYQKQEHKLQLINGSEILFRSFDRPEKILSMNLAFVGVDQLEEIVGDCFNVGDRLTQAVTILKRTESPRTESLVAELADCGKSLQDLSAKLLELETSLSASA